MWFWQAGTLPFSPLSAVLTHTLTSSSGNIKKQCHGELEKWTKKTTTTLKEPFLRMFAELNKNKIWNLSHEKNNGIGNRNPDVWKTADNKQGDVHLVNCE